ncbi:MAG: hypothetical protein KKF33_12550 [Alphaproteobacteria bacterium]|nr:hypothetical protein [Alphaproteobacteria bacterium]
MADEKLSDIGVHTLLHDLQERIGKAVGETVHGDTAIETVRRVLMFTQIAHLTASEKAAGRLEQGSGATDPTET